MSRIIENSDNFWRHETYFYEFLPLLASAEFLFMVFARLNFSLEVFVKTGSLMRFLFNAKNMDSCVAELSFMLFQNHKKGRVPIFWKVGAYCIPVYLLDPVSAFVQTSKYDRMYGYLIKSF